MKGNCVNCARCETCGDICGVIFGFCAVNYLPDNYAKKLKKAERLRAGDCVVVYKTESGNVHASHAKKTADNVYYTIPRSAKSWDIFNNRTDKNV